MKRFVMMIALVTLMMMLLSGCCLSHDMQPATCTEPARCSKCGKTEGEPLGHTALTDPALAPTCTETGLSEGSHCQACGEVLGVEGTGGRRASGPHGGHRPRSRADLHGARLHGGTALLGLRRDIEVAGAYRASGPHGGHCPRSRADLHGAGLHGGTALLGLRRGVEGTGGRRASGPCTEPGCTEGLHCSVCGEILKSQELIEPHGHDWEEATFSHPRTCRICGETEGAALGAGLFVAVPADSAA